MTANFINGTWIKANGSAFASVNPADGSIVWEGHSSNENDVHEAIASAQKASSSWAKTSFTERCQYLKQFADKLTLHKNALANTISKENGKPLWESLTEVQSMIAKVDISIKAFEERSADVTQTTGDTTSSIRHRPHGVVAVFGPYNFPGHLANGHIVPALLAGNTIVFKPSELTPAVAEHTLKIWQEAALPAGVLNLVQGAALTGNLIVKHPMIQGLFFTGSTKTGLLINDALAKRPNVILALEMGGNNPLVIESFDNINAAVFLTLQSAFLSAGQRCTCARRLVLVENSQTAKFMSQLISATKGLVCGAYTDQPEPYIGPLINEATAKRVYSQVNHLVSLGAIELVSPQLRSGTGFMSPALIDVTDVKTCPDEEIFGPVLQVIRVKTFDDAIIQANNTQFGLAAGLISTSEKLYTRFAQEIRAGIINWNVQLTGASSQAPFGGVGVSGNHRPSAYFAADYCSYPVASIENHTLDLPSKLPSGLTLPEAT